MNAAAATFRSSLRGRLARAVAAVALVTVTAPATAQTVTAASISPSAPTWRDRAQVTVTGMVSNDCTAPLGAPVTTAVGNGTYRIDLTLSLICAPIFPGSEFPISFRTVADLDPLEPGSYTLRILGLDGAPLAQVAFEVYEVGAAALELPAVSTANHPGTVRVTWLAGPGSPAAQVAVDGHVVTVSVGAPPALPAQQLVTLDVPLPPLSAGQYELRVLFPGSSPPGLVRSELHVLRPAGCAPDATTLCLHDGRFRVTATWRDFAGRTGVAHAAPLAGNEGSGLLWFFGPDNTELTVKVLDACTISQRWWTFVSSSSTVQYTVTVTDTATGTARTYTNPLGQVPRLVADTAAFACP